ncbi:MAG: metallophosphoesterase [Propionibacteriaceae bacterium]
MARKVAKIGVLLGGAAMALVGAIGSPVLAQADEAICAPLTTPVYQRIDPDSKSNFLTTKASEATNAIAQGYTQSNGTPFAVSVTADDGLRPVHKLYRAATGDYLYTISSGEVAAILSRGTYVDQGVSFYATTASSDCGIPVYRLRGFSQHRLVVGATQRDNLIEDGWKDEGVAFYAGKATGQTPTTPAEPAPPAEPTTDTNFSFAVMPDTQQEVLRASDTRFKNRTQWLVKNEAALDLRFVTSSGDVVNWDTPDHSQYEIASAAMEPLEDAAIPYSLAIGNHDTAAVCEGGGACDVTKTSVLFRDTSTFNSYFTAERFGAVKGAFEPGKVDNEYSTFSAGGVKWMVLVLEMWPRPAAVDWAQSVVESHPDYNVMVVTHSYLDSSGNIDTGGGTTGKTTPKYLFDNLIKQYPNIKFVFSGHVGEHAKREDTGVNGNKIYSFLETFHDPKSNPVRLVTVDTKANTLKTWVYAPYTDDTDDSSVVNLSGLQLVR